MATSARRSSISGVPRGDAHPPIVADICRAVTDQTLALLQAHQTELASQVAFVVERALSDLKVDFPATTSDFDAASDVEQVEDALRANWHDDLLQFEPAMSGLCPLQSESPEPPLRSGEPDAGSYRITPSPTNVIRKGTSWFSLDREDHARRETASKRTTEQQSVTPPIGRCVRGAQACISSCTFEALVTIAILSNSVLIGAEVEMAARDPDWTTPLWLIMITHAYTLLFFVELAVRFAAHKRAFFRSEDWKWNCFDVVVVMTSLFELCVDVVGLLLGSTNEGVANVSNIRLFRVIRIARLLRAVRIARIVSLVTALRLLVSSMLVTLRSLIWAFILMLIIIYIFAIVFTQSVTHPVSGDDGKAVGASCGDSLERHWGSLGSSMFTLYESVTGGVSWEAVADPLGEVSWHLYGLFLLFIFIMYFAVLNVVTGFFCQAASSAACHDPDVVVQTVLSTRRKNEAQIRNLFRSLDIHRSGEITYYELCEAIKDARVQAQFEGLQVDVSSPWTLFKLINLSKSGSVDIDQFIMGCMRLKGTAKSVEVEKLQTDMRWFMKRCSKFMHKVDHHLATWKLRNQGDTADPIGALGI